MDEPRGPEDDVVIEGEGRGVQEIDFNRWYVLGATENTYAVWRRGHDEPIATFPRHDAGYASAEALFDELGRGAWLGSPWWARVLTVLIALGLLGWAIGGSVVSILYVFGYTQFSGPSEGVTKLLQKFTVAEAIGYRLWLGSLAVLVTAFVLRRLNADRQAKREGALARSAPSEPAAEA